MKKIVLLLGILFLTATAANAVILSDNLNQKPYNDQQVTADNWITSGFATDAASYSLSSVSMPVYMQSATGAAEVDIFSNNAGQPGSKLETLTLSFPINLGSSTFTSSGLALNPDSTYWVVLKVLSGTFDWQWTESNTGTGVGFLDNWGFSQDSGTSWGIITGSQPQVMQVVANSSPVPLPPTALLFGSGLLGLVGWRFRKI